MENGSCNFFSNNMENSNNNNGESGRQISNNSTPSWDFWKLGTTTTNTSFAQDLTIGGQTTFNSMCPLNSYEVERRINNEGEYYYPTDNHQLMCLNLNLGKRHYIENNNYYEPHHEGGGHMVGFVMNKRGRQYLPPGGDGGLVGPLNSSSTVAAATLVPRCQVEGCQVALVNAKAYHRRHKVCEMHAKAPKVVVLGLQQRFCQQCSRFHSVSEFDESKRSCRRRLAGHNERRRKSFQDHYTNNRNPSQGINYRELGANDLQGGALSLLSSKNNDSWISNPINLPATSCSELIADNRAANLAQQLILDKDWHGHDHHHPMENLSNSTHNHDDVVHETHGWGPMNDVTGNLTLSLMHIRNSEFGLLSGQEQQPKEERVLQEEGCQERWNSFAGAHIS